MSARDEQRARLKALRDADTDPVRREAYAMAERAGFDWYDTESMARRAFQHAAEEIVAMRATFGAHLLKINETIYAAGAPLGSANYFTIRETAVQGLYLAGVYRAPAAPR